jgi:SAM-dependent methyltransferase
MSSATTQTGSADQARALWGARPRDWAAIEDQQVPTYEVAIDRVGLTSGQRVLEVGCGTGVFLRMAAERRAEVHGLDASPDLLAIARERVPDADLRTGDMQFLPWEDGTFDVVAGFNAFFFAADMIAALREAGRVARPGAAVVIQVWGRSENCDLTPMKAAIAEFVPSPPPGAPRAPALWQPGVLEQMATSAGLTPEDAFDLTWAFDFPDAETLGRAMVSPGPVNAAARTHGEVRVRAAIVDALEPHRTPDGGYLLQNEWHFLVARA